MSKNQQNLRVDWTKCVANGACAELLPELIQLDEWGYPVVDGDPLPPVLEREARSAVAACPKLALKLMRA